MSGRSRSGSVLGLLWSVIMGAMVMLITACGGSGGPAEVPTDAVFRLEGPSCARSTAVAEGTGVAVGPDVVATAAHVLAEMDSFTLRSEGGAVHDGEVVWLDVERDVALIQVDPPVARYLPFAGQAPETGETGLLISAAEAEPWTIKSLTVGRSLPVTLDGAGERQALELEGVDIADGDSGSPVLDRDRDLIGMVFASSRPPGSGWAVAAAEIQAALATPSETPITLTCEP